MLPSMETFLKKLHESNPKAAILSIYPGYLEGVNCKTSHEPLPQAMSVFYNQSLECLLFTGIITESTCNRVFSFIVVTTEEVQCFGKTNTKAIHAVCAQKLSTVTMVSLVLLRVGKCPKRKMVLS